MMDPVIRAAQEVKSELEAQCQEIAARLAMLDEIIALAGGQKDPAQPSPAKPSRRQSAGERSKQRAPRHVSPALVERVRGALPGTVEEVARVAGTSTRSVHQAFGELGVLGSTSPGQGTTKTYRLASEQAPPHPPAVTSRTPPQGEDGEPPPAAAPAEAPAAPSNGAQTKGEPRSLAPPPPRTRPRAHRPVDGERLVEERRIVVKRLIAQREPVAFGELQRLSGIGSGALIKVLRELHDLTEVQMTGHKSTARYHLTETLDRQARERGDAWHRARDRKRCREELLNTFRIEPGKWTERRIAETGTFDREIVAEVCGQLLDEGLVVCNRDGTYYSVLARTGA